AKRAVASTRYPPDGVRGVAGTHRGSRYGTIPNYLKRANEEACVIVQIETLPAFDQLASIAAIPGVDSIFIGPGDLSASMRISGLQLAPGRWRDRDHRALRRLGTCRHRAGHRRLHRGVPMRR